MFAFHIYHFRNFARTLLCLLHKIYVELFLLLVLVRWFSDANTYVAFHQAYGMQSESVVALQMAVLECSFKFRIYILSAICVQFRQKLYLYFHFMVSTLPKAKRVVPHFKQILCNKTKSAFVRMT